MALPEDIPAAGVDAVIATVVAPGGVTTYALPPAAVGVQHLAAVIPRPALSMPAAAVSLRGYPPVSYRFRRLLVSPQDTAILAISQPILIVGVALIDGDTDEVSVSVEVRWGTEAEPIDSLSTDVDLTWSAETVSFTIPAPLDPGRYLWQTRLVIGGQVQFWTPPWSFTIDPSVGAAALPIAWTVTSTPPTPHLWTMNPTDGQTGEEVTLIGQGFPATQGTVTVGATLMPVQSWQHIAATADGSTADRVINDTDINVQHDEIVVLIPDVAPPGGAVTVHGEGTT